MQIKCEEKHSSLRDLLRTQQISIRKPARLEIQTMFIDVSVYLGVHTKSSNNFRSERWVTYIIYASKL